MVTPYPVPDDVAAIANAVTAAWYTHDTTGRVDVPVAVVATLAAIPHDPSITGALLPAEWTPTSFMEWSRRLWSDVINDRPQLFELLDPLLGWLVVEWPYRRGFDTTVAEPALATARAAIAAGQTAITGTDRRFDVDLLGTVLATLRHGSLTPAAHAGSGWAPNSVAHLSPEYLTVTDPAMGTGDTLRSTAATMRAQGVDPHAMCWMGCETDALAVACARVNALSWDLGEHIVFHVGDAATEPNWPTTALARRAQWGQLAAEIVTTAKLFEILTSL